MKNWNRKHDQIFNNAASMNLKEQYKYLAEILEDLEVKEDFDYYNNNVEKFHNLFEKNFSRFNEIFDAFVLKRRLEARLKKIKNYIEMDNLIPGNQDNDHKLIKQAGGIVQTDIEDYLKTVAETLNRIVKEINENLDDTFDYTFKISEPDKTYIYDLLLTAKFPYKKTLIKKSIIKLKGLTKDSKQLYKDFEKYDEQKCSKLIDKIVYQLDLENQH